MLTTVCSGQSAVEIAVPFSALPAADRRPRRSYSGQTGPCFVAEMDIATRSCTPLPEPLVAFLTAFIKGLRVPRTSSTSSFGPLVASIVSGSGRIWVAYLSLAAILLNVVE